ncbi:MAG: hypothetical protein IJ849_02790 [Selenomonadaceae bacterium]|nr:hypothetical protein [Selenomonadaceae bacterium]
MDEEAGRVQFHQGFYAAMKVEYDLAKAPVSYDQEKELGEKPVKLDFLIIKKDKNVTLSDPIGKFFRRENLFEYKSPEDGLSIDDFYKAQGYGLMYKSFDRKVNSLPISDLTLTLVRHAYPREMVKALENDGFAVVKSHSGIYRIEGKISIPTQLVVTSRLPSGEYAGLKLLAKGCTAQDIIDYSTNAVASNDETIKDNASAVIRICLQANETLGKKLKGANAMNDVIARIFKPEIDAAAEAAAEAAAKTATKVTRDQERKEFASDLLRDGMPLPKIVKFSKLSEATVKQLARSLGVAVV